MKHRTFVRLIAAALGLNVASFVACLGLWLIYGPTGGLITLTTIALATGMTCLLALRSARQQQRQQVVRAF